MPQVTISDRWIKSKECEPPAPGEVTSTGKPVMQRLYWDEKLRGFGLRVEATGVKTFIVQRTLPGTKRAVRVTLGRYGEITLDTARDKATEAIAKIRSGVDPNAQKRERGAEIEHERSWRTVTLAQAIEFHVESMKGRQCKPDSIERLEAETTRHLGDWMNRRLVEITPADCIDRHNKVSVGSGRTIARRVMRHLRAAWKTVKTRWNELPEHPLTGITRQYKINKNERRREPIPWAELPGWWEKVQAINNPVRRDFQLFCLFTGLRGKSSAATVKWEHVRKDGTLRVEKPKSREGEDRSFDLPLCSFVLKMLEKRRAENIEMYGPDCPWVFPRRCDDGTVTHISETKEQEQITVTDEAGNKRKTKRNYVPTTHRSRDTFASACDEAEIPPLVTQILLNHLLPKSNVTEGYQRPSTDRVRKCVERVAAVLLEKAGQAPANDQAAVTKQAEALVKALGADMIAKLAGLAHTGKIGA